MKDLIAALTILSKYGNPQYPTHCEHDVLTVNIDPDKVTEEDQSKIVELGFFISREDDPCFKSYRFGSA